MDIALPPDPHFNTFSIFASLQRRRQYPIEDIRIQFSHQFGCAPGIDPLPDESKGPGVGVNGYGGVVHLKGGAAQPSVKEDFRVFMIKRHV